MKANRSKLYGDFFRKLAERRQLAHAYLFSGNDQGKKQSILDQFFLSAHIEQADRTYLRPLDDEISIRDIRKLNGLLSMSAWGSPYKVAVIEKAHTMNQEAQSAFLKLLEEPKGEALYFLLTDYAELLLQTIRSRTQEYKFYTYGLGPPLGAIEEYSQLQSSALSVRFAVAKTLAGDTEVIDQRIQQWLMVARELMRQTIVKNPSETQHIVRAIKMLQEVSFALRTSNINPRLALERFMLEL